MKSYKIITKNRFIVTEIYKPCFTETKLKNQCFELVPCSSFIYLQCFHYSTQDLFIRYLIMSTTPYIYQDSIHKLVRDPFKPSYCTDSYMALRFTDFRERMVYSMLDSLMRVRFYFIEASFETQSLVAKSCSGSPYYISQSSRSINILSYLDY